MPDEVNLELNTQDNFQASPLFVPIEDESPETEEVQEEIQTPVEQSEPSLIMGKFKTQEDLANSYQELERQFHRQQQEISQYRNQAPVVPPQRQPEPEVPTLPAEVEFNPFEIPNQQSPSAQYLDRYIEAKVEKRIADFQSQSRQQQMIQSQEERLRNHLINDLKKDPAVVEEEFNDLRTWASNPENVTLENLYRLRHLNTYVSNAGQTVQSQFDSRRTTNQQSTRPLASVPSVPQEPEPDEVDILMNNLKKVARSQSFEIPFKK